MQQGPSRALLIAAGSRQGSPGCRRVWRLTGHSSGLDSVSPLSLLPSPFNAFCANLVLHAHQYGCAARMTSPQLWGGGGPAGAALLIYAPPSPGVRASQRATSTRGMGPRWGNRHNVREQTTSELSGTTRCSVLMGSRVGQGCGLGTSRVAHLCSSMSQRLG